MLVIHLEWPLNGLPTDCPDSSHILTALSILPVAKFCPSGLHASAKTHPEWPLSVYLGVPLSVFHILAVLSPDPVASKLLVLGENCAASIASPCPGILFDMRVTACTLKTA